MKKTSLLYYDSILRFSIKKPFTDLLLIWRRVDQFDMCLSYHIILSKMPVNQLVKALRRFVCVGREVYNTKTILKLFLGKNTTHDDIGHKNFISGDVAVSIHLVGRAWAR